MNKRKRFFLKIHSVILSVLVVAFWITACAPAKSFDDELERIVSPYAFNLVEWELNTLPGELKDFSPGKYMDEQKDVAIVKEYFSLFDRINSQESEIAAVKSATQSGDQNALQKQLEVLQSRRSSLERQVQDILERQIGNVLSELGIYNPADVYFTLKVSFPPISFELTDPPYLLVISPRERIETRRTIMLKTSISLKDREQLESKAEKLDVSALAIKLGGVATYPSFVSNRGDLRFVIDTAIEEWLHQYLTFRPLGFRYFLSLEGVARDYDIAALDETVASMTAKEIGGIVYNRYYRTPTNPITESPTEPIPDNKEDAFDFNKEMRETRKIVDIMLSQGKISEAKAFMEERRQFLATQGYYLRKLNQAYFAFYGSYTDSPTSIDPLGSQMRELRKNSNSIKDFLDRASFITSREDLAENLRQIAEP